MSYAEALEYLFGLQRFGLRPGLDTTLRLASGVGHPERSLRFIHVAGTNGKGSTCAFLESIYRASGLRVGLYSSPHLICFRERIQVDRTPIPEVDVARILDRLRLGLGGLAAEEHPTLFEFTTVLALCWFAECGCDVVIWETGLGGRLDATNIVTPLASVITNIGWDHMQWLGNTLESIAAEKAGIIKPGVPVFTAADDPGAFEVIGSTARERGASLSRITSESAEAALVRSVGLSLEGEHQVRNSALAVAIVSRLQSVLPVTAEALRRGLAAAQWAGRFQRVPHRGGVLVLDGAHNHPAFEALAATLAASFHGRSYVLVLGLLADKDPVGAVELLVPGASRIVVVPVHSKRGGDPADLARRCEAIAAGRPVERAETVSEALGWAEEGGVTVLTGSLYLVGEALGFLVGGPDSERGLNDWSPNR